MALKYTDLHVTVNTNFAPRTHSEQQFTAQALYNLIVHDLQDPTNVAQLLPTTDGPESIEDVTVNAIGIEVGSAQKRLHAHFNVQVEHHSKVLLANLNKVWAAFFSERLAFAKGCHAHVQLLPSSAAKNYSVKGRNR